MAAETELRLERADAVRSNRSVSERWVRLPGDKKRGRTDISAHEIAAHMRATSKLGAAEAKLKRAERDD